MIVKDGWWLGNGRQILIVGGRFIVRATGVGRVASVGRVGVNGEHGVVVGVVVGLGIRVVIGILGVGVTGVIVNGFW
jgi:hypothetical protein